MDLDLHDSLADDYLIFDNKVDLTLKHTTSQLANFSTGKFVQDVTEEIIRDCLIRQMSDRQAGTVRQIFEKGKSISNDSVQFVDTIIEVPVDDIRVIQVNDTLVQTLENGTKKVWQILSIDIATLGTRHRLGCRKT